MQSTVGSGTRFMMRIPCQLSEASRTILAANPPSSIARYPKPCKRINVLVAEDNKLNQKLMTVILQTLSYDFTIAADGCEAIKLLDHKQFDIVLMDLQMPKMDGLSATRAIRARADSMRDIPIIGLTANAMDEDRERCLTAGMSTYVSKPFNIEALGALIASFAQPETNQCESELMCVRAS